MVIKLKYPIQGSLDGVAWPPPGVPVEVQDHIGAKMCAQGIAIPVKSAPKVQMAVPPAEDVETRAEPKKRGPGRPRKVQG